MNPITPTREVTLADGKSHQLVFNHRAFSTAEYQLKRQGWDISLLGPRAKEFWLDIASGGEADDTNLDQFKIGVLLYCGLIHENPKLTLTEAQDLITFGNMVEVTTAVLSAALEAMAPFVERAKATGAEESPLAAESGGVSAEPQPDSTSGSPTPNSGN